MRKARLVLSNPEKARDLNVAAAIVPISTGKMGWDVTVQVAVELDSLMFIPAEGRQKGTWEVGALLSCEERAQNWEMLGVSDVRSYSKGVTDATVVHQRVFEGLRPGKYRLGAFVRDRLANNFGGAVAMVELPEPRKGGIIGPILMKPGRKHWTASLPLFRKKTSKGSHPQSADTRSGLIPAARPQAKLGETLEILAWICPGEALSPTSVLRYVAKDGVPLFRFEEPEVQSAGECLRMADRIETSRLVGGAYSYHVKWKRAETDDPMSAALEFEVASSQDSSSTAKEEPTENE